MGSNPPKGRIALQTCFMCEYNNLQILIRRVFSYAFLPLFLFSFSFAAAAAIAAIAAAAAAAAAAASAAAAATSTFLLQDTTRVTIGLTYPSLPFFRLFGEVLHCLLSLYLYVYMSLYLYFSEHLKQCTCIPHVLSRP